MKKFLMEKLSILAKAERDDRNLAKLIDTKIDLNFEQRARLNWLKYEDKNTKFFHSQASQ